MKSIFQSLRRLLAIATIAIAAPLLTGCFSQIDTGNVGVTKTGGQYNQTEITPGWSFTGFSTVYEVSGRENAITFENMTPRSANQIVLQDVDIDIYVQLNTAKAAETMTRFAGDLGKNKEGDYVPGYNYVSRIARETAYEAFATIDAADMQKRRSEIPALVQKALQTKLDAALGEKGWFTVTQVNLRNIVVDPKLEESQRAAAQQIYDNQKKDALVEAAKKDAEIKRQQAQGEADAARIKAEGLRSAGGTEYLKLLELQNQAAAIAKWNGVLPSTSVGAGANTLLQLK